MNHKRTKVGHHKKSKKHKIILATLVTLSVLQGHAYAEFNDNYGLFIRQESQNYNNGLDIDFTSVGDGGTGVGLYLKDDAHLTVTGGTTDINVTANATGDGVTGIYFNSNASNEMGTSMQTEDLVITVDTQKNNNTSGAAKGIEAVDDINPSLGRDHSLTVDGKAVITVTGAGSAYGIQINSYNKGSLAPSLLANSFELKNGLQITAKTNSSTDKSVNTMGIMIQGQIKKFDVKGDTVITTENVENAYQNYGIYLEEASANFENLSVTSSNGRTLRTVALYQGANLTATGKTVITSNGNANSENYAVLITKSDMNLNDAVITAIEGKNITRGVHLYSDSASDKANLTTTGSVTVNSINQHGNAYGINLAENGNLESSGDLTINADASLIGIGLYSNKSTTEVSDLTINASSYNYETRGISLNNNSTLTANKGKVTITTTQINDTPSNLPTPYNFGIYINNSDMTLNEADITADGGDKMYGIYMTANNASDKANLTANGKLVINTLNANKGGDMFGIRLDKNSNLTTNGELVVNAGNDIDRCHIYAIRLGENSNFTANNKTSIHVDASGYNSNSAYGLSVFDAQADFNDHLDITAGGASVNVGIHASGGTINGTSAAIAVDGGTAIQAFDRSTVTFTDAVLVDAEHAITATGTINIEKDFISIHDDSEISADDLGLGSGVININSTENGVVQFSGTTETVGNGELNMNLTKDDSYWKVTGDSELDNLKNNQLIDMTADKNAFSTLTTTGNFTGSGGTIHMDIDASTNTANSDRLFVNGTHSGTHYITLNNIGADIENAAGTVLVSVNDEQGQFKANDSEGTLYWNRYDLGSQESTTDGYTTDWYLKNAEKIADKPTTTVDVTTLSNAIGYYGWYAETDKLMKRMGDLRSMASFQDISTFKGASELSNDLDGMGNMHGLDEEQGAWFRVRGGKFDHEGSESKYNVYELGYDRMTKKTDKLIRFQGAALSYIDGSNSFTNGSGETNGKSIAFYTTEMHNKGHYLDLVFRIADMDSDYSVYDTNGNKITGSPENVGVSLSAEYGRKNALGDNGWYIEPQGQLTLGYYGGDNYETSNGIKVHQSGIPSVVGRVGFNIGRDINDTANVYLKADLLHEFMGDYEVRMTDSAGVSRTERGSYDDTWFEYGIGAAVKTGKNNHLYFDFTKTAGGDFEKDWQWNAGMRWTF